MSPGWTLDTLTDVRPFLEPPAAYPCAVVLWLDMYAFLSVMLPLLTIQVTVLFNYKKCCKKKYSHDCAVDFITEMFTPPFYLSLEIPTELLL